jgi:glycerate dehydrogenase
MPSRVSARSEPRAMGRHLPGLDEEPMAEVCKIVFLDRGTIGPGVTIGRPRFSHEWVEYRQTAGERIVERLQSAEIAVTNKVPLRGATLDALPDLKFIAVAATGTDVVDLDRCRSRGIVVSNIRGYATRTVPEHVFALILALRRNLVEYRTDVLGGRWQKEGQFCFFNRPIYELAGSTLGLVGSGALARAVGAIGGAFGMDVIYCNEPTVRHPADLRFVTLEELLRASDAISIHCPLTPKTRNMIGRDQFRAMKRTAVLVNTARGGIVDEAGLAEALRTGTIAGAALDVVSAEPPTVDSLVMRLSSLPNFILTPHVAWASVEAMQALSDQLIANIEAYRRGEPLNVVS